MKRLLLCCSLMVIMLTACDPQPETATPEAAIETESPTATALPAPTPTMDPPNTLTVCTAQLPESLFPYNGSNLPAKANLLSILYEAPFESVGGEDLPVILDRVPSLANGDLRLEPVTVQRGQTVVDSEGDLAVFQPGLAVRPSGCRQVECAVIWDGEAPLQMDRMVVDFTLRARLAWSDGEPVVAGDSVFSFRLAEAPEAPGLHWAADRTDTYQALDETTIQWIGRPGFSTGDLSRFFWLPLPAHLFTGQQAWVEMAASETLAQKPLGYGPFQIQTREGDRILLTPNPHYFGAVEGLPLLDELVFRQVDGGREAAIQALAAGECDVLDDSFGWANDPALLSQVTSDGLAKVHVQPGEAWWQLVFGIAPADYDDVYNPAQGDRPDFFGDPAVRRAIAACVDREALRARALGDWGQLWPSFLPPEASQLSPDENLTFNPELGAAALEAAGWQDTDADPITPRVAVNVPGIPGGTAFKVELLADTTQFQGDMAEIIQVNLAGCGIEITIQTLPPEALYAPGPDGPLFGRRFDLALIAWQTDPALDCRFYLDQAIPNPDNQWVGTNIAGLAPLSYDQSCATAGLAFGEERSAAIQQAELAFLNNLPAFPLFSPQQMVVYSPKLCLEELLTEGKGFFNRVERLTGDKNCP